MFASPKQILALKYCLILLNSILEFSFDLKIISLNKEPRGKTLPNFKTYYKNAINKTVYYWLKDRQINGIK